MIKFDSKEAEKMNMSIDDDMNDTKGYCRERLDAYLKEQMYEYMKQQMFYEGKDVILDSGEIATVDTVDINDDSVTYHLMDGRTVDSIKRLY